MIFCEVWIRGVRGIFSWHLESMNNDELRMSNVVGARVVVLFRGRKRVGIVVGASEQKPDFKTQPIIEVWDGQCIPSAYVEIARAVAEEKGTPLSVRIVIGSPYF